MKHYEDLVDRLRTATKLPMLQALCNEAADEIAALARKENFHAFLWNTIQPNEMEAYIAMYNSGNEKEADNG